MHDREGGPETALFAAADARRRRGPGARRPTPTRWPSCCTTSAVGAVGPPRSRRPRRARPDPSSADRRPPIGARDAGVAPQRTVRRGPQAGRQGLHDPVVHLGHLLEQLLEGLGVEHDELHRRLGHDGGVARLVLEQRHLAHHRARARRGDVLAADVHAGLALEDDVALLADPTLLDEHRARLGVDVVGQLGDPLQLVGREPLEEGHPRELLDAVDGLLPVAEHRRSPCVGRRDRFDRARRS